MESATHTGSYAMSTWSSYLDIRRPERKADHPPASSALYAFMPCRSDKATFEPFEYLDGVSWDSESERRWCRLDHYWHTPGYDPRTPSCFSGTGQAGPTRILLRTTPPEMSLKKNKLSPLASCGRPKYQTRTSHHTDIWRYRYKFEIFRVVAMSLLSIPPPKETSNMNISQNFKHLRWMFMLLLSSSSLR